MGWAWQPSPTLEVVTYLCPLLCRLVSTLYSIECVHEVVVSVITTHWCDLSHTHHPPKWVRDHHGEKFSHLYPSRSTPYPWPVTGCHTCVHHYTHSPSLTSNTSQSGNFFSYHPSLHSPSLKLRMVPLSAPKLELLQKDIPNVLDMTTMKVLLQPSILHYHGFVCSWRPRTWDLYEAIRRLSHWISHQGM